MPDRERERERERRNKFIILIQYEYTARCDSSIYLAQYIIINLLEYKIICPLSAALSTENK